MKALAPFLIVLIVFGLVCSFALSYKVLVEKERLDPEVTGDFFRDVGAAIGPFNPGNAIASALTGIVNGAIKLAKLVTLLLIYPIRYFFPTFTLPFAVGLFVIVILASKMFLSLMTRLWESTHSASTMTVVILLSAVIVFIASSVMHMFLGYHWNDLRAVPREAAVLEALRGLDIPPGDYALPRPDSMRQMRSPEFKAKFARGPVVLMTVAQPTMAMGRNLAQWFVYLLVVGLCCAYIAGRELGPGASYLSVFRIVGFTAFMAYALALPQASIWYRRNWRMTVIAMIDGLVFALVTAGMFGWLWPR